MKHRKWVNALMAKILIAALVIGLLPFTANIPAYAADGPYTVTYDANGGTGAPTDPTEYAAGADITINAGTGMTREGKLFTGWNTAADGTGTKYTAGKKIKATESLTLYAQWANFTEVTEYLASITLDEPWISKNEALTAAAGLSASVDNFLAYSMRNATTYDLIRKNKTESPSSGWYGTLDNFAHQIKYSGSRIFVLGTFTENGEVPLEVTARSKGYDGQEAEWSATSSLSDANIRYEVSTDGGATWTAKTFTRPVITEVGDYQIKVTATRLRWHDAEKIIKFSIVDGYCISYQVEGAEYTSVSVATGSTAQRPADPEKAGHSFEGWFKDAACTVRWKFADEENPDQVTEDTILYGKFYPYCIVSFDMNGHGDQVASIKVASGSTATRPANPTGGGEWSFGEWYKDSALTKVWHWMTDVVTTDITLYACWYIDDKEESAPQAPARTGTWNDPVTDGTWSQDASGAWYYKTNASFRNTWGYIRNPYAKAGQTADGWYYFDANGRMLTGWQQIGGSWYFLNNTSDGTLGMCFLNCLTPDGYRVDANGAAMKDADGNWIRK